jgi:hypothetical protein
MHKDSPDYKTRFMESFKTNVSSNWNTKSCNPDKMEKNSVKRAHTPSGTPSRSLFILGGVGAIISGVAVLLLLLGGRFAIIFFRFEYSGTNLGVIALGVGLIIEGMGYMGIKRNYGVGTGTAGFVFSIVAGVSVFVNLTSFRYLFTYWPPRYSNGPSGQWFLVFVISTIIALITLGVTQILWGIAHVESRDYTGNSGLAMATGIMLILSGALTASVIMAFAGMTFFFISEILALQVFLKSKIPQQTTQKV